MLLPTEAGPAIAARPRDPATQPDPVGLQRAIPDSGAAMHFADADSHHPAGWDHERVSRDDRAVFRLPGVSCLIPVLLFVCVTPLANAGADFWLALYVVPLLGLIYILVTRTVADTSVIRTTGLIGGHRIAWSDLDGFEFRGSRWAIAVAVDGRRVRLPMVRPRDMPRLAVVSGGRLLLGPDAPPQVADPPPAEESAPDVSPSADVAPAVDGTSSLGGPLPAEHRSIPDGQPVRTE